MTEQIVTKEIDLHVEAEIASILVDKAHKLLHQPIPEAYKKSGEYGIDSEHPHPSERLDINNLLVLFEYLHLEPGYRLDYIYHNRGSGGSPSIYVRFSNTQYPSSDPEDFDPQHDQERPYLEHLYFGLYPMGYLQLAIFSIISGQFYLFWHSGYNDHRFVLNQSEALLLVSTFNNTHQNVDYPGAIRMVNFTPHLTIFENYEAILSAYTFSQWNGFSQREWKIRPLAYIKEISNKVIIPYNCGILF
ncbi:MAG: hypothetical protein M1281_15180 [Chloroflexi bacterium]|nr:hypothetical protein [Chloroflexota bacterium]